MPHPSDVSQQQRSTSMQNGSEAEDHIHGAVHPHAVLNALLSVKACQQQRVQQYSTFNASFRRYLDTGEEIAYR